MLHWFIIFEFGLRTSTYGTYSAQAQSNSPACEGCFRQFCHRIYIGCHQVDVYGSYMRDRPFVSVGSSIPTAVWVGAISQFFSHAKHPSLFSCSSSHLAARSFPYHLFSMTSVFCHSSEAFEVPLDLISRYVCSICVVTALEVRKTQVKGDPWFLCKHSSLFDEWLMAWCATFSSNACARLMVESLLV